MTEVIIGSRESKLAVVDRRLLPVMPALVGWWGYAPYAALMLPAVCGHRRSASVEGTGMTPPGKKPRRGAAMLRSRSVTSRSTTRRRGPVLD